jgi:ribosomal-protein-alanine N-acetyltransferase
MKNPFLIGKKIYLRGLSESDLDPNGAYFQWLNDPEVSEQNSHGRFPNSQAKARKYFDRVSRSDSIIVLAIVAKDGDQHIGNICLQDINWINRSAELAILIGEKDFWGKGIAEEASKLLMKHGFNELNLHRIHCATTEKNIGMQKLAVKLGMKEEGRQREVFFKHGEYLDFLTYGILHKEFHT